MSKIWNGEVGFSYDAMEHTLEENIQILGKPLAEQIEKRKGERAKNNFVVADVDTEKGIITLEFDE